MAKPYPRVRSPTANPHGTPHPFAEFASLPLRDAVSKRRLRLGPLTLAEVEVLVQPLAPAPSSLAAAAAVVVGLPPPGSKLAEIDRAVIQHALDEVNGNVSAAARLHGVDRKQLQRKVARHRLR